jgi:hypothetical protein
MLLYVTNNTINYERLSNFTKLTKEYNLIYSNDGIYKIEKDVLYKVMSKKEGCSSIMLNNKSILIDESEISYSIVNSIPMKHVCLPIRAEHYKLNKNVTLILEYNEKKLYNVYFINNSKQIDSIITSFL